MGDRARAFAGRLADRWRIRIAYRRPGQVAAVSAFSSFLRQADPRVVYVFDMALAGVVAATFAGRGRGPAVIIDTGDAIAALARSSGMRGPAGQLATRALEWYSLRSADRIVVRGTFHQELLARAGVHATVIPDGVDCALFQPMDGAATRDALGLGESLVVGLVGSSIWSQKLGIAYGWDLVEMLALVKDLPVSGLLVGDGSGIEHLRARARALGVEDRLVFAGRRPLAELPALLAACDICLSTQTNDVVGQVRTTGKLPLYLACGKYVLATRVGEAARVLPDDMLLDYEGVVDRSYPGRLAGVVRALAADRSKLARGLVGPEIARRQFDYDVLAERLDALLTETLDEDSLTATSSVTTR